jgi:hypothetical protein
MTFEKIFQQILILSCADTIVQTVELSGDTTSPNTIKHQQLVMETVNTFGWSKFVLHCDKHMNISFAGVECYSLEIEQD